MGVLKMEKNKPIQESAQIRIIRLNINDLEKQLENSRNFEVIQTIKTAIKNNQNRLKELGAKIKP